MSAPSTDEAGPTVRQGSLGRYLLATSRPRFWLYLGGTAAVGVAWGADDLGAILDPVALAVVAYFLVPANLFLYGVNDRFDAATDARNPRKGADGPEVRTRAGPAVAGVVTLSGLVGLPLALVLPALGVLALLVFLFLAVAYSAPPLRLKARPLLDSVSNGLYVLPGVVGYAAVAGEAPSSLVVLAAWFWTMGMHTFSAIPDVEPDRAAGVETTATLFGEADALVYVLACWIAAAVAATAHAPALGAVFLLYPGLGAVVGGLDVPIERAYTWFPVVNAGVGTVLTLAGLWRVAGGL
jgi:4-hydroxybenzoate polyprenyltransferase